MKKTGASIGFQGVSVKVLKHIMNMDYHSRI